MGAQKQNTLCSGHLAALSQITQQQTVSLAPACYPSPSNTSAGSFQLLRTKHLLDGSILLNIIAASLTACREMSNRTEDFLQPAFLNRPQNKPFLPNQTTTTTSLRRRLYVVRPRKVCLLFILLSSSTLLRSQTAKEVKANLPFPF